MSDKEQRIRTRAYEIWEREGRREGRAEDHWRQAELEVEQALKSPNAQAAEAPDQPAKTAGNRAGPSAKAIQTGVDATGLGQASKKPTTSRSKKASADAKPSEATKKPTAMRSREAPPA
jgi:hypothetical protein